MKDRRGVRRYERVSFADGQAKNMLALLSCYRPFAD
jgi:hypothetical protein